MDYQCTFGEMFTCLERLSMLPAHSDLPEQVSKLEQAMEKCGIGRVTKEKESYLMPKEVVEAYRPMAITFGLHIRMMNTLGFPLPPGDEKMFLEAREGGLGTLYKIVKPFYSPDNTILDYLPF